MNRSLVSLFLSGGLLLSCGPEIEPPSRLESFRVLGVQKDRPYAKPGETVTLRILLADELEDEPRPVDVLWITSCANPLRDLYAACAPQLAKLNLATDVGRGIEHSYVIPADIIEPSRKPPYGLSVVFFAACAGGTIRPDLSPELLLPIACVSPDGERLGSDSFVIGYTQLYAYADYTNTNPVVTGFTVEGEAVPTDCIGEGCARLLEREVGGEGVLPETPDGGAPDGGAPDGGASDGGAPDGGPGGVPGEPSDPARPCGPDEKGCVDACSKEDRTACPKIDLELQVDTESAERNSVIEATEGGRVLEQMWVNYYVDRGRLLNEVKLLNDATIGWNDEHEAEFIAPKTAGPLTVWAVAHDNRGGTDWARVQLRVACPEGRSGEKCRKVSGSSSTP